jgi:hypothetical protein
LLDFTYSGEASPHGSTLPAQQGEEYDQRALNKLAPAGTEVPSLKAKDKAPAFLATL